VVAKPRPLRARALLAAARVSRRILPGGPDRARKQGFTEVFTWLGAPAIILAVAETMHWRVVPDVLMVCVNTQVAPSDEEWDAYIAEILKHLGRIKGVLVYSETAGPSAPQRTRATAAFGKQSITFPTAIMSGSRIVRGIVTALSWAAGDNIKAFATTDFKGTMEYLGLDSEEELKTRVVLKGLARSAGITVAAFADESGTFRQKYGK
jgi:hypothetical protein